MELISSSNCYLGQVNKYKHFSTACQCEMKFNLFVPENPKSLKLPGLIFLSGLTCTEDNFMQKACAIERSSELGLFLICPDTSPRGCEIEGEEDSYDIGTGAGFYVDATEPKWSKHYRMYSYIEEILELVINNFPVDSNLISIFGHSMGGHGALTISLRNPDKFRSCSAFAPICNPMQCPWGQKAFTTYLGSDKSTWEKYDATELFKKVRGIPAFPILISQGSKDEFYLSGQLLLENFTSQIDLNNGHSVAKRLEMGFDHSYWFIQSFIKAHLDFHARCLGILNP